MRVLDDDVPQEAERVRGGNDSNNDMTVRSFLPALPRLPDGKQLMGGNSTKHQAGGDRVFEEMEDLAGHTLPQKNGVM